MVKDLGMIAFGKVKQLEKRVSALEEQVRNKNIQSPENQEGEVQV
jgi:hypothetical protein